MLSLNDAKDAVGFALRELEKTGARYFDARVSASDAFAAVVTKSKRLAEQPRSMGVAVRALQTGWGYGASATLDHESIRQAVQLAAKAARATAGNRVELASVKPLQRDFALREKVSLEQFGGLDAMLPRADEEQRFCLRQKQVIDAQTSLSHVLSLAVVGTSEGSLASKVQARTRFFTMVTVKGGSKQRDFVHSDGIVGGFEVLMDKDWRDGSTAACKRARELLSAVSPQLGTMPVILSGSGGGSGLLAHESVGHAVEGDYARMDRSYFNGKLGTAVAAEQVSLVDSGVTGSGWGEILFDDEAVPAQKTYLIRDGVFETFMLDREAAHALQLSPTGNARAQDSLRRVYVRMRNTYIEPRDWTPDEIVADTKRGIFANHWKAGIEDPAGGSFQLFFVDGYLIENGELTKSIYNLGVSNASTLDSLKKIDAIGNDFAMDVGGCGKGHADYVSVGSGGPTLRLQSAIVGGG